jgi:uncharacterized membrane protein YesL
MDERMDARQRLRGAIDRLLAILGLLGNVLVASLAWTALAVFILPLPAASAALFFAVGRAVEDRASNPFADVLTGVRLHWRRATTIGGPAMLLGLVLGVDTVYFLGQPSITVLAAGWLFASAFLLWCAVMLMFWPILVTRDLDWRRLLRESFWLTMATLPWRLLTVAVAAVAVLAAVLYPFLIPLAPGAVALVASWLATRTFRRYALVGEAGP